jgi:hypothetical protein
MYKNNERPFNQPYSDGIDDPIKWWTSMELEPPYLQSLALRLFSICPNSASCEQVFLCVAGYVIKDGFGLELNV